MNPARHLLFGLAVLLLLWGASGATELLDAWQERREEALTRALRQDLDRAIAGRSIGFKAADALWKIQEMARSGFGSHLNFQRSRLRLEQEFACSISLFLFQDGRSTLALTDNASQTAVVARLLEAMKAPARQRVAIAPALEREARILWGPSVTVTNLIFNNGKYIPITTSKGRGIASFSIFGTGSGLVLIVEHLPPEQWVEFSRHRSREAALHRRTGQGIPELAFWAPPRGYSPNAMALAWNMANTLGREAVTRDGTLWIFDRDRTGTVTAVVTRLPASNDLARLKIAVFLAALLLPFLCRNGLRQTTVSSTSLRGRMRLLFLAATLLPLLSTLGIGWMSLQDQEARLRDAAFATGMIKLHTVNAGFSRTVAMLRKAFRDLHRFVESGPFDAGRFQTVFAPLRDSRLCHQLLIFDTWDHVFHREIEADRTDIIDIIRLLSRSAFHRFIPERIAPEDQNRVVPADLVTEQITSNAELGWAEVTEIPDTVHRLQIGFSPADIIWNTFPRLATGPAFMVGMSESEDLLRIHLERAVLSRSDAIRLYLFEAEDMLLQPAPLTGDRETLTTLLHLSHMTGRVVQREVRLASGTAWVVVSPDTVVHKLSTAAVLDADRELSQLDGTRLALALALLASLLTAFAAGQLLSGLVLVPIADLQHGIDAIRHRRSDVVIPFRRDDEFGHLARIFNHALGELKDLELARIVQTSLLPATTPVIDGYTLAAVNLSATDLSGDSYDLIRCADGSLLMLIGDVTGHGASAALAMAMARATVGYRLADGESRPTPLLTSLNEVFHRELRSQRKYMTMLMVRLDPATHRLTIESAGHNYPLLHAHAAGTTTYLEMTGFPLGVRKQSVRDTIERTLAPGDAFVMYTDGYTECMTRSGEQIGDEALRKIVDNLARTAPTARQLLDGLLLELDLRRAPGPLGDDVTLVVLRRNL
ncbi:MAG TPA: SpoIIE family protein phosphatase [Candidatus Ozemobacteraceae bacterium]